MNTLSNFSQFALTRSEMRAVSGGINMDCYCYQNGKFSGGFGFTAKNALQAGIKMFAVAVNVSGCNNSHIKCNTVG